MTKNKRVELYRRLPEIYRIKDEGLPESYLRNGEPVEAYQLKSFLEPVEEMFSVIHENIESLYHDFFIETCDEWVIPYIADLLGTSHLAGDPWTLRADVADTILVRRSKGTLGAIELLAFILTKWGVHAVELRENMIWNQHLNHQRPDRGGSPPYGGTDFRPNMPVRGGTVNLRDPARLALLNGPFDPFAHVADVQPAEIAQTRYNLPNLAIYLWRLKDYRVRATRPAVSIVPQTSGKFVLRITVNPVPSDEAPPGARPIRLFSTNRSGPFSSDVPASERSYPAAAAPRISGIDELPDPISPPRLTAVPGAYAAVNLYDPADAATVRITDVGLQVHIPGPAPSGFDFSGEHVRSGNLCAWEQSLRADVADGEIVVDPIIGRICIGVPDLPLAQRLEKDLLLTFTYGAVGEVGAHPVSYPALPSKYDYHVNRRVVYEEASLAGKSLQEALEDALTTVRATVSADEKKLLGNVSIVIEITDSLTHTLNIESLSAPFLAGDSSLKLDGPLIIRAADQERPIVKLSKPLAFCPAKVAATPTSDPVEDKKTQSRYEAAMDALFVRLEGLYLARGSNFGASSPIIRRAALNKLEIISCTLDPGGYRRFDGTRAVRRTGIRLSEPYGFTIPAEEREFKQTPQIVIQRSICGAIFIDEGYRLCLADSIVESMPPSRRSTVPPFAITGASDPSNGYAAPTVVKNVTILGPVRAAGIEGSGAIFTGVLEALDQQSGCLKYCYFTDDSTSPVKNRLPQQFACVSGAEARLIFTSEFFSDPGYCQLSLECDRRILEEGSGNDQMGAFNFLLETHKWRNLRIRFREFMPVGTRPLLIPAT
jgi:hypothetical protein